MKVIDDDDDFDDDERKKSKTAKFVSNNRSGHDDQFCPKIVKIGAILAIFRPFEDFGLYAVGGGQTPDRFGFRPTGEGGYRREVIKQNTLTHRTQGSVDKLLHPTTYLD